MDCPRLKHYARMNSNGTVGRCGHMIQMQSFDTFDGMESSEWLKNIKNQMSNDVWPIECLRCKQTEELNGSSIRTKSIERHRILYAQNKDYLIVGGVLDNVCNSACISCNETLSTKIGSLLSKNYYKVDNTKLLKTFPTDRIYELDINGGEPSSSKNYKKLLTELPKNTKIVRINTNGSKLITEIIPLLQQGIRVIITLSLDGTKDIHNYVRWPIKWTRYIETVNKYIELKEQYTHLKLEFWTTVSCLNLIDIINIKSFADRMKIPLEYGILNNPLPLNIRYKNFFTTNAKDYLDKQSERIAQELLPAIGVGSDNNKELGTFLSYQDTLRKINHKDYYKT